MAIEFLLADSPPDIVLAGINKGWNIGYDIAYSGTVGAALEALLHGVGAMAFAECSTEEKHLAEKALLRKLVEEYAIENELPINRVVNINFPQCDENEPLRVLRDLPIARVRPHRESYKPDNGALIFDGEKYSLSEIYKMQGSEEINDLTAVMSHAVAVGYVPSSILR